VSICNILVLTIGGCGGSERIDLSGIELPSAEEVQAAINGNPLPVSDESTSPDTVVQPITVTTDVKSIENLFGQVTFSYNFSGSDNIYTDSVIFTANSEMGSISTGLAVVAESESGSQIACGELGLGEDFLCLRMNSIYSEGFAFSMDSQFRGSGVYKFCIDPGECGSSLANDPDGPVRVTISPGFAKTDQSGYGASLNGLSITETEAFDYKRSDKLQFGTTSKSESGTSTMKEVSNQLLKALEN